MRGAHARTALYVADMHEDGVYTVNVASFTYAGFIETGRGAHGFVVNRGGARLFVANRGWHMNATGRHGPGTVGVIRHPHSGGDLAGSGRRQPGLFPGAPGQHALNRRPEQGARPPEAHAGTL